MQITETRNESLSRSYSVVVPAAELGAKLEARITEIGPTLNLKGFRPGKAPASHVRRMYGKALMSEVVEKTLNETSQQVLEDNKLRVASQPDLKPSSDMDEVLAGRQDLAFALDVEVMPDFEPADVASLELTRLTYAPTEAEIAESLKEIADQNRTYAIREGKTAKAKPGDQVLVDFVGSIDGQAFEGGSAEGAELVLGSGRFIPGFEAQLEGAKAGEDRTVNVTFPADYQVETLKGKSARFAVSVKEVRAPKEAKIDDALAINLGLSDLTALREAVRANLEGQYAGASRFKLKRALLDALDSRHDIPLPPRMVEAEFEGIWRQVQEDEAKEGRAPEDEGKSEATLKGEYRRIAERRVRLGLVLAEIGRRENVAITDQELNEAMRNEARRYGEMAQQMFDYLRQNPQAQASLRAPLYEEKVVDLILSKAKVSDRAVAKEVLLEEDDLPEGIREEAPKAKSGTKAKPAKAAKEPAKAAPSATAKSKPAKSEKVVAKAPAPPAKVAKATAGPKAVTTKAHPAAPKASKPAAAKPKAVAKPAKG